MINVTGFKMKFREMWDHKNGSKQYELVGSPEYWFMFPTFSSDSELENKVTYIRNGELISYSAPTLKAAENKYRKYLISEGKFKLAKSKHGGVRIGAGRKKKLPTKPIRLSEDEQALIRELRTSCLNHHELVKKLVKFMAVCELSEMKPKN
jgi:hypothetical protein